MAPLPAPCQTVLQPFVSAAPPLQRALPGCLPCPPVQMTLALYVGNAIKDLVCSPRPLGVSYGKQRLRLLGAQGEEAELNAKVRASGGWVGGFLGGPMPA